VSYLRQIKNQTTALLADLGNTSDEVAESLREARVLGVPRSNRSCPVALYLSSVMGPDPRVRSVAIGHCSLLINVASPRDLRPAGRLLVQLPKPVRRFVAAFDNCEYPAIIRGAPVDAQVLAEVPR
jgi:hypothetical protein